MTTRPKRGELLSLNIISPNTDLLYEGVLKDPQSHTSFEIFFVRHTYLIPHILEIAVCHAPTFTEAERLYIPIHLIKKQINIDDLHHRVHYKAEKCRRQNVPFSYEDIADACTIDLIIHILLSNLIFVSNTVSSSVKEQRNVSVSLSIEGEWDYTFYAKPLDLVPVEILKRKSTM